jgi:hypothetical protein
MARDTGNTLALGHRSQSSLSMAEAVSRSRRRSDTASEVPGGRPTALSSSGCLYSAARLVNPDLCESSPFVRLGAAASCVL